MELLKAAKAGLAAIIGRRPGWSKGFYWILEAEAVPLELAAAAARLAYWF